MDLARTDKTRAAEIYLSVAKEKDGTRQRTFNEQRKEEMHPARPLVTSRDRQDGTPLTIPVFSERAFRAISTLSIIPSATAASR